MKHPKDTLNLAPTVRGFAARATDASKVSQVGRLAPWFVTLWLIFMTGWYAETAVRCVRAPINDGNQMRLAVGWLILVGAVALLHLLWRGRVITAILGLALLGVGLAMTILSRQWVSALIAVWFLILACTWGDWLLRRTGAKSSGARLEWLFLASAIGLVFLSMVGLTLLLLHRMSESWTWMVLVVLTAVQWRSFLAWFERIRHRAMAPPNLRRAGALPEEGVLLVLLGVVVLFNLAWALAPEITYDGISYHLAVPKAYLAERGLVKLTYGYNSRLIETIFTVALALHGQIVAKLLILGMSIATALGVYALGERLFTRRVGLWAAALFYSTPLVSSLSNNSYNDLPVALFLVATFLAFLRWRETRQVGWLLATGFLAGAAISTKLTALLGLPVIGFLVAMNVLRVSHASSWSKVKTLAGCGLAAALVSAPYFVIAYAFFRNPFFPLLNGIVFDGSLDPARNLNGDLTSFGLGYSPLVFLKMPFVSTFQSQGLGRGAPAGSLGIALAILPLGLLIVRRNAVLVLTGICAIFLALLCYTVPSGRYYIAILPEVVVLAIAAVVDGSSLVWLKRLNLACLAIALVAQVAVIPLMYWSIPDRVPLSLAFGAESQESFLGRAIPFYRAVQYLNRSTSPGEKILSIGGEQVRFYLERPVSEVYEVGLDYLRGASMPETAAALAKNGFAFLLVQNEPRQARRRLFRPPPYLRQSFLARYAVLEHASDNTYVYRFRRTAAESVGERNWLTNPGFEFLDKSGLPSGWQVYGRAPRIVNDANRAHTGQISALADSSGGLVTIVPVKGDKVYSLGHWSRADRSGQDGRVQINWLDGNLNVIDVTISVFPAAAKWTWREVSGSAPSKASFAHIYLSVHGNSEVFFDDYAFVEGELQARP